MILTSSTVGPRVAADDLRLAENAAVALIYLGGFPGGIEVMERNKTFLHVGAGTHFLGAADEDALSETPLFDRSPKKSPHLSPHKCAIATRKPRIVEAR